MKLGGYRKYPREEIYVVVANAITLLCATIFCSPCHKVARLKRSAALIIQNGRLSVLPAPVQQSWGTRCAEH